MKNFILSIIAAINAIATGIYLSFFPANKIALHIGIDGKVDRYGSKWELLMIMGIIFAATLIYDIVQAVSAKRGSKNKNKRYSKRIVYVVTIFIMVLMWVLTIMSTTGNLEDKENFATAIINVFLGCLLAFVGNMSPKFRQNKWFGFKTKATLSSEKVWNKTHRFMGYVLVIGGIITIIMGIVALAVGDISVTMLFISLVIFVLSAAVIPYIYASSLYKKEKNNESNQY